MLWKWTKSGEGGLKNMDLVTGSSPGRRGKMPQSPVLGLQGSTEETLCSFSKVRAFSVHSWESVHELDRWLKCG